jgi:hypothetical protein
MGAKFGWGRSGWIQYSYYPVGWTAIVCKANNKSGPVLGFYPGGTGRVIKDMARGFLTVSLSDAEPIWQGGREGGPRRAEGSRGSSKERERNRRGRTKSGENKVDIQTAVQDR